MLYLGHFWSWYTGFGTQKISPKNQKVLYPKVYFYQTVNNVWNLLKIVDILDILVNIKYSMVIEKHGNFMRNHLTLLLEHATGDHSKQLRPWLYRVQNYWFQFKVVIGVGKMDYQNFIYLFCQKKINQIKESKIPRSLLLIYPVNSEAQFSIPWEPGLYIGENVSTKTTHLIKRWCAISVQKRLQKSTFCYTLFFIRTSKIGP